MTEYAVTKPSKRNTLYDYLPSGGFRPSEGDVFDVADDQVIVLTDATVVTPTVPYSFEFRFRSAFDTEWSDLIEAFLELPEKEDDATYAVQTPVLRRRR